MTLPRIMAVVNVTPDSFSDGGRWFDVGRAVDHALALVDDGADIVDIGGESTRPGSEAVAEQEELRRVLPVIEGVQRLRPTVVMSVDTSKAEVARQALDAGATIVNDVTAGRGSSAMFATVANAGATMIVMHMAGTPRTMQEAPAYDDVVGTVAADLERQRALAEQAGIRDVWVDPGIGFGKTVDHNLQLLRQLDRLAAVGPVVVGLSRKRFLGHLAGITEAADRDVATVIMHTLLLDADVHAVRVHDVRLLRQAWTLAAAFRGATLPAGIAQGR